MKQREFKKSVNLRCPTTAFKDIFALISFGIEKDGEQLSSLANWAEHTWRGRDLASPWYTMGPIISIPCPEARREEKRGSIK